MLTKTCPVCRTVNQASFPACIRCGTRFDDAPPTPPEYQGIVSDPSAMPPPPGLEEKSRSKELRAGIIAILVVLALIVGGLVFVLSRQKGGFPDTLGGYERNQSEAVQEMEDAMGALNFMGVSMDVAVYGSDANPSIVAFTIEGLPEEGGVGSEAFFDSFEAGFTQGFAGSGGQVDESSIVEQTIDGVDYVCMSFSVAGATPQPGAMCVFNGEVFGALMVMTTANTASALRLSEELYRSLA